MPHHLRKMLLDAAWLSSIQPPTSAATVQPGAGFSAGASALSPTAASSPSFLGVGVSPDAVVATMASLPYDDVVATLPDNAWPKLDSVAAHGDTLADEATVPRRRSVEFTGSSRPQSRGSHRLVQHSAHAAPARTITRRLPNSETVELTLCAGVCRGRRCCLRGPVCVVCAHTLLLIRCSGLCRVSCRLVGCYRARVAVVHGDGADCFPAHCCRSSVGTVFTEVTVAADETGDDDWVEDFTDAGAVAPAVAPLGVW